MMTLVFKDLRLSCLPLTVAVALMIAPYFAAALMVYRVYAPDTPSVATIADYLATASVFGLLLNIVASGMLAGNIVACERVDNSAVFLASQPISNLQALTSKAIVVVTPIAAIWIVHMAILLGIAPGLAADARPYARIDDPAMLAASATIVSAGVAWLASIVGRSPSLAISAGLAAAFAVPWGVYLLSFAVAMAPDDLRFISTVVQWAVGLGAMTGGTAIYLNRVEP